MALYIVNVPDPPLGTDWFNSVPGQYIYNVTGVRAVLTAFQSLTAHDATGNGNDGQYFVRTGYTAAEVLGLQGAFAGDAAVMPYGPHAPFAALQVARNLPTTMVWSGDYTIEWWQRCTPQAASPMFLGNGFTVGSQWPDITATGSIDLIDARGQSYESVAIAAAHNDLWHYYAISLPFAASVSFSFDGTVPAVAHQVAPGLRVALPAADVGIVYPVTGQVGAHTLIDEVAFYPRALSVAERQAHFAAAAGGFAAYSAAILADSPAMYYHLDEVGGPGGRQPALQITDGSQTVELIPTGFPDPSTAGVTTYSWQPNLQAHARSGDDSLITVPVPDLLLPAGYTIGTETPDLGADDQWSEIVVWWDSDYSDIQVGIDAFAYPPGAHLVYHPPSSAG